MFEAEEGETLYTSFVQSRGPHGPAWTLTMGSLVGASKESTVVVQQPYMDLGVNWEIPTTSWAELNYTNMCINACWELYGAVDPEHLPSSGSHYDIQVQQPKSGDF